MTHDRTEVTGASRAGCATGFDVGCGFGEYEGAIDGISIGMDAGMGSMDISAAGAIAIAYVPAICPVSHCVVGAGFGFA